MARVTTKSRSRTGIVFVALICLIACAWLGSLSRDKSASKTEAASQGIIASAAPAGADTAPAPTATASSEPPAYVSTGSPTPTGSSTPTKGQPSPTSVTPTKTKAPISAAYVADVTVPDDTVYQAGTDFVKTWTFANDGGAPWPAGSELRFVDGDELAEAASVPIASAAQGEKVDISVPMKAPSSPGRYRSYWQVCAESACFGPKFYVQIIVSTPTVAATVAPPVATVAPFVPAPAAPARACCKICTSSKACGNSCISFSKTCHQPPGCACDG